MKSKYGYLVGTLAITALILGGCGSTQKSSSSKASSSTKTAQSSSVSSTTQQSSSLWNSSKDAQLTSFINKWAPTMGQSYTKYDGHTQLKTATNSEYPKDLSKDTVNGSHSSIGWAPSGKGKYEYNVVAMYNYNNPNGPEAHITYAFAFHNGQPVALVSQSTNGTPDWTPTKNTDVSGNFAKIAEGRGSSFSPNKSNSSSSSSSNSNGDKNADSSDPKAVGKALFKYFWKTNDDPQYVEQENGKWVASQGTASSAIEYTISGDTVTYSPERSTNGGPIDNQVNQTISVSQLMNK